MIDVAGGGNGSTRVPKSAAWAGMVRAALPGPRRRDPEPVSARVGGSLEGSMVRTLTFGCCAA